MIFGHLPSSICGALKIDFERFDTNVSKTDNIGCQKNDSRNGNPDNTNVFYFTVDVGEIQELIKSNKEFRSHRIVRALIFAGNKDINHLEKMI